MNETDEVRATLHAVAKLIVDQAMSIEAVDNVRRAGRNQTPWNSNLLAISTCVPYASGRERSETVTVRHAPIAQDQDFDDYTGRAFQVWLLYTEQDPTRPRANAFIQFVHIANLGQLSEQDGIYCPRWNENIKHIKAYELKDIGAGIAYAGEFLLNGYLNLGVPPDVGPGASS